jgi:Secretion system C-terminal sorting domain
LSVTVLDEEGNIIASSVISNGYFGSISISTSGEIAGCTDPNSCNYNAEATCDDLSCNIYCGGCTDETALNYNPYAQFEDGSCIYFVDPPLMGMIIMPDEENNQYYVMVNMVETGNGAPYVVSDDAGSEMMMIENEGQYLAGPYPCDQDVVIQLESMSVGMQEYFVSSPLNGACTETVGVDEEMNVSSLKLFPNPANQMFSVTGISGNTCDVLVYDINGRQVMNQRMNVSAGRIDVNCDEFTSGLYQVRISDFSGDSILRVIVE